MTLWTSQLSFSGKKMTNSAVRAGIYLLRGHTSTVRCLKMSDKNTAISGSRDTTLRIWDLTTGTCRNVLVGHQAAFGAWPSTGISLFLEATILPPEFGAYQKDGVNERCRAISVKSTRLPLTAGESLPAASTPVSESGIRTLVSATLFFRDIHPLSGNCRCEATLWLLADLMDQCAFGH